MNRPRVIVMLFVVMLSVGCKHHHKKQKPLPTTLPQPVIESRSDTMRPPPSPHMPVKQGAPPLAYIVESGGSIQVVDADSGSIVAQGMTTPQQIVSVDQNAGVRIGNQLI